MKIFQYIKIASISSIIALPFIGQPSFANGGSGLNPFIGQIKYVAFNFAPRGWAKCDGQILPISSNQALFSILGTTYGGDGRTSFALPDMRGRVNLGSGNGAGLTERRIGSRGGNETTSLQLDNLPSTNYQASIVFDTGASVESFSPFFVDSFEYDEVLAQPIREKRITEKGKTGSILEYSAKQNRISTNAQVNIPTNGENMPHNNLQPHNTTNCIIALTGVFPSRN